jgi:hypothetical protein
MMLVAAICTCTGAVFAEVTRPLTFAEVREAQVCLPSIGDPPDRMVPFSSGHYMSDGIPFAEMRAFAAGRLNGKDVAAVEVVWNTGGSGNWEVVALCRRVNGRARCSEVYSPGAGLPDGGTMVGRMTVANDRINLYGEDPVHRRSISMPLVVSAAAFASCRLEERRK